MTFPKNRLGHVCNNEQLNLESTILVFMFTYSWLIFTSTYFCQILSVVR